MELERPALRPLPAEDFPFCRFGTRKVYPDGHVEVDRAYYSVPHRYVGREVEVCWDERMVRILVDHEIVAVHRKLAAPGRFTTRTDHLPARKTATQAGYQAHLLARAERLGPGALGWAHGALERPAPWPCAPSRACSASAATTRRRRWTGPAARPSLTPLSATRRSGSCSSVAKGS